MHLSDETKARVKRRAEKTLAKIKERADAFDNRRCRRIVTTLRNTLMLVDMASDYAVTGDRECHLCLSL